MTYRIVAVSADTNRPQYLAERVSVFTKGEPQLTATPAEGITVNHPQLARRQAIDLATKLGAGWATDVVKA